MNGLFELIENAIRCCSSKIPVIAQWLRGLAFTQYTEVSTFCEISRTLFDKLMDFQEVRL
jgi:hypothetical protein